MATGLRHAAHPLQFRTVQVVGTRYLGAAGVNALLPLLQIVGIVAAIGIESAVVEFHDDVTHAVQEETVVGNHEQRLVASLQEALEPLYHLQVQVVGGLVKYEQIGLSDEHIGQGHTLLLSARQLPHGLFKVAYFQLRQYLLGFQHLFFFAKAP